jgi:hypothetical protein
VFAYKLDPGSAWGTTDLSGLVFGGADGPKGNAGFLDARATREQRAALQMIAGAVFAQGGPANGPRAWTSVPITHTVNGNDLRLDLGAHGGFRARVIVGRDGRSPVVVENNTVWPIRRAIKGKALPLQFSHPAVGTVRGDGTNANYGAFSFSGRTGEQRRAAAVAPAASPPRPRNKAAPGACCGTSAIPSKTVTTAH